jgi:hypothetical protein
MGATVPDLPPDAVITGAQAVAIGHEVLGDLFPAMRTSAVQVVPAGADRQEEPTPQHGGRDDEDREDEYQQEHL